MNKLILTAAAVFALSATAAHANEAMAKKNGCMGCHQVAKKVVGPAFKDIAAKYKGKADAVTHLSKAIKSGSKGVWGPVPMAAQPKAAADADALAKWIMTL